MKSILAMSDHTGIIPKWGKKRRYKYASQQINYPLECIGGFNVNVLACSHSCNWFSNVLGCK